MSLMVGRDPELAETILAKRSQAAGSIGMLKVSVITLTGFFRIRLYLASVDLFQGNYAVKK